MPSAIRKHLNPATALAFVALVFALTGGAFAASGRGGPSGARGSGRATASTVSAIAAKSKAKSKTGPRGPAGPKGATGAAGPAGATGPAGPTGPTGPAGPAGGKGENGANGAEGKEGKEGAKGKEGKEGKPGAIHGQEPLPSGATETGVWSFGPLPEAAAGAFLYVTVASFPVQLSAALEKEHAHFINTKGEEVTLAGAQAQPTPIPCPGNVEEPTAEPGNLCVYENRLVNVEGLVLSSPGAKGADKTGAIMLVKPDPTKDVEGSGSWAVTAE